MIREGWVFACSVSCFDEPGICGNVCALLFYGYRHRILTYRPFRAIVILKMRKRLSKDKQTITIYDIAEELGLSSSTVSRALNNKGRVGAQTQQEVLKVAKKLGYRPSMAGRSLVTQQTGNIGFLVSKHQLLSDGSFYGEVMEGAEAIGSEHGYRFFFSRDAVETAPQLIAEGRVDGIILAGCEIPAKLILDVRQQLPVVIVDDHLKGIDSVMIDNVGGAREAVTHLIRLGHREIGFITETLNNLSFSERFEGYKQALEAHGIGFNEALVSEGIPGANCGYVALQRLLQHTRSTAVFAANDEAAAGAIRAIKETDLQVPEDIAVVGFDDGTLAPHTEPPLTSVRVFRRTMGRWAATRLLELIEDPNSPPVQIEVSTKLVIRGSCGMEARAESSIDKEGR